MSQSIEWASADQGFDFLTGSEEAADGESPNGDDGQGGENVAIVIEGCAIYGTPGQLLEFFAQSIAEVSAHLAGQQ